MSFVRKRRKIWRCAACRSCHLSVHSQVPKRVRTLCLWTVQSTEIWTRIHRSRSGFERSVYGQCNRQRHMDFVIFSLCKLPNCFMRHTSIFPCLTNDMRHSLSHKMTCGTPPFFPVLTRGDRKEKQLESPFGREKKLEACRMSCVRKKKWRCAAGRL